MGKYTRYLLILVSVVTALALLSSCSAETKTTSTNTTPATTTASGPKPGGTLRLVSSQNLKGAVGVPWETGPSTFCTYLPCVDFLVRVDSTGKIIPMLAKSWTTSDDGLSVTFNLRDDVKFNDGTQFNAEAAKFNIDKTVEAKWGGYGSIISSSEVVDRFILKINLKQPATSFSYQLSKMDTGIGFISPAAFNEKGIEWCRMNPVGTGAYKLTNYVQSSSASFVKNPDYWRNKPNFDALEITVASDIMTAQAALQKGEGDIGFLPGAAGTKLKSDLTALGWNPCPNLAGGQMCTLIPDSKHPDSPLSDIRVRQAIWYAINRDTICKNIGYGVWKPMYQQAIEQCSGYNADMASWQKYDVEKAKKLVAEYGKPININLWADPGNASPEVVTAVQGFLAVVGINVTIQTVDIAKFTEMRGKGWDNGLIMVNNSGNPFWASYLDRNFSATGTLNTVMQRPDGFQDALVQALTTTDSVKRTETSKTAVKLLAENSAVIPLFEGSFDCIGAPYLKNISIDAYYQDWTRMWFDK